MKWGHRSDPYNEGYRSNPKELEVSNPILGVNLLRIIFDPSLPRYRSAKPNKVALERAVRQFRKLSFSSIGKPRYTEILEEMKQFDDFTIAWQLSSGEPDDTMKNRLQSPHETVENARYGKLSFMSLRVPNRYLQADAYISIYVPIDTEDEGFLKLQKDVTVRGNQVHTFTDHEAKFR